MVQEREDAEVVDPELSNDASRRAGNERPLTGGVRYDADRQDAHRRPPPLHPARAGTAKTAKVPTRARDIPPAHLRAGAGCPERRRHAT